MGLMYPFPVSTDESDFIAKKDDTLTLKTYGLPYIFWIYAICSVAVVLFMYLAIKAPIHKLIELGDDVDILLGRSLLAFIGSLPFFIFAFFFYEKRIVAGPHFLRLEYRVFYLKIFSETFHFAPGDHLSVDPFLNSPNVARMKAKSEEQGFQNKGYFVLWLKNKDGKKILIDRHSRKADLEKLKNLLENVVNTQA